MPSQPAARSSAADITPDGTVSFYYYLTDQVGSIIQIVDEQGTVVNQYDYDVWGNPRPEHTFETIPNRFRFQGREWDAHRNEYYYRSRTYASDWNCFTSLDMDLRIDTYGLGSYAFCGDNPTHSSDPFGDKHEVVTGPNGKKYIKYTNDRTGAIRFRPVRDRIIVEGLADYDPGNGTVSNLSQDLTNRANGVAMVAGGTLEMIGGTYLFPLSLRGSGVVIFHGLDVGQAGLNQIWTGEIQQTMTSQVVQ